MITPESLIKSIGDSPMPPVEKWDPDYCGELDLQIKADGTWLYGGTPFTRRRMQILFSRIIKKENDQYFLVTPVEKLGIKVEWLPFTIIDFDIIEHQGNTTFQFIDNCDNSILLTQLSQLELVKYQQQVLPSINIRRNLFASFNRSCYYRLIEQAKVHSKNIQCEVILTSNQTQFCIGQYSAE